MKILLLETGRGTRDVAIAKWRATMELHPDDQVSLLSWQVPPKELPVQNQLYLGPRSRMLHKRSSRLLATIDERAVPTFDDTTSTASEPEIAGESANEREQDLSGIEPEAVAHHANGRKAAAERTDTTPQRALLDAEDLALVAESAEVDDIQDLGPLLSRQRLKAAARWRVRKGYFVGRAAYRRGRAVVILSPHPAAKRARMVLNTATSLRLAGSALSSPNARRLFAEADLVVPLDARSMRTAWVLARRIQGPAVFAGLPAAKANVAEYHSRRAATPLL